MQVLMIALMKSVAEMKPVVSRSKELFSRRILNFRVVDSVIALAIPFGTKHGMILSQRGAGVGGYEVKREPVL
jgi:hypothetical protein